MAAFFGKNISSQLLHYLESHVWDRNWDIFKVKESIYVGFKFIHIIQIHDIYATRGILYFFNFNSET